MDPISIKPLILFPTMTSTPTELQSFSDNDAFGIVALAAQVIKADLQSQLAEGKYSQQAVSNALKVAALFNVQPAVTGNATELALGDALDSLDHIDIDSYKV